MAKELPRIAKSSEQTAFASEESYFVLESISKTIQSTFRAIQLLGISSLRQDMLLSREIEETNGNEVVLTNIHLTLQSLVGKFDEFIETLKRTALRDSLNDDQTTDNTTSPGNGSPSPAPASDQENNTFFAAFGGLGFVGKALSLALGAAVGALTAYVKTIRFYANILVKGFSGLVKVFKFFSGSFLQLFPSLSKALSAVRLNITSLITGAIMRVMTFADGVRDLFGSFKNLTVFAKIKDPLKPAFAVVGTVVESVKSIGSIFNQTSKRISGIVKWVSAIKNSVMPFAKLFSKIFFPLTVIITAFDTIKAAISGFLEAGILGGIEGAITGFFNSLIFGPLDMIKSAVAWVMGFFGFDNAKKALNSFSFAEVYTNIVGSVFDSLKAIGAWIGNLFNDPVAALSSLWDTLVGGASWLIDIVYSPINMALNWIKGLFGWGDPEEDFKLQDFISDTVSNVLKWIKSKFSWIPGLGGGDEEAVETANENIDRADSIRGSVARGRGAAGLDSEGNLVTARSNVTGGADLKLETQGITPMTPQELDVYKAEQMSIRDNATAPTDSFSISSLVMGAFNSAKEWITDLFTWDASEDGETNVLGELVGNAVDKVKTFFTDLFDFLPSLDDIKSSLVSILPNWMQPASIEEKRSKLLEQLTEMETKAAEALPAAEQFDNPLTNDTREDYEAEAAAIRQALSELEGFNKGGIAKAPKTGGLAVLHGTEIIAPLESPQGKILNLINESFKQSTAPMTQSYSTTDKSGSMANVMNSTQRSIEDMRASTTNTAASVVNNYNVVQGGTNINAPTTALAITNPGRKGPGSRPDRR